MEYAVYLGLSVGVPMPLRYLHLCTSREILPIGSHGMSVDAQALGRAPSLHQIARAPGRRTDKDFLHGYTHLYPTFLEQFRGQSFDMLEIGVLRQASLHLWDAYFPRARVYGADWGSGYNSSRIFRLDQSNSGDLRRVAAMRNWTVVIDDGSHKPSHQLSTFITFFPRLAPGGVYIIEDVETNYWAFGRSRSALYGWNMGNEQLTSDVVGLFREAVDRVIMREFMCTRAQPPVFTREVDAQIAAVTFIHNAIIVMKRTSQMHTPASRYRFAFQQDCGGPHQHPRTGQVEVRSRGAGPA